MKLWRVYYQFLKLQSKYLVFRIFANPFFFPYIPCHLATLVSCHKKTFLWLPHKIHKLFTEPKHRYLIPTSLSCFCYPPGILSDENFPPTFPSTYSKISAITAARVILPKKNLLIPVFYL